MRSTKPWLILLGLAGLQDVILATYHFILPYQWGWERGLHGVPASLVWSLYALNFSWSLLALIVGCLILYAAKLGPDAGPFATRTVFAVGLFWLIHGIYTVVNPLPMPRSLAVLRVVLLAFPAIVVLLHWTPLFLYRKQARGALSPGRA